MRILQVTSARHFGGGERHFIDLTNGLVEKGHELFVAVAEDSPLIPDLPDIPSNILRLPFRKPFDLSSACKLRQFARRNQIEIVHAHMARDYPLAALAAAGAGHPRLVITRHVLFPMGQLHRLTRRRVARVIAVSEAVGANLRRQRIFDDEQIVVVRHGIDLNRFAVSGKKQEAGRLRVAILGELSPVKGQIDFVNAAAIVATERDDVEFVIAGRDQSSAEYGASVKALIRERGLTDRIELIESPIDVPQFLSRVDLLVSSSRSEAFGLAIVEAMACGVPVVATETEGAREIIQDGETGKLVAIGDVEAIAAAMRALLADADRRKRLAAKAQRMVAEKFSLERMVSETEAVYHSVVR